MTLNPKDVVIQARAFSSMNFDMRSFLRKVVIIQFRGYSNGCTIRVEAANL